MLNQRAILSSFRAALQSVGYEDRLIAADYEFADFEGRKSVVNRVALAAFSGYPCTYRNACIGLVFAERGQVMDAAYAQRHRALGAPLVFEVNEKGVQPWRIGPNEACAAGKPFAFDAVERTFHAQRAQWSADTLGRLKSTAGVMPNQQLDFYDVGLMPVLEEFFQSKLKDLLERSFKDIAECYKSVNGHEPGITDMFPYLFRFVTAKIFMDRADARGWDNLNDPLKIFEKAEAHCGAGLMKILPAGFLKPKVLAKAWSSISENFHFQNLSVPDLAFVYESSFINEETRRELGIHSTPLGLADYIVENLPWADLPVDQRRVFEPCCGHGIFLARALERLGRDLAPELTPKQRHKYFREMLVGVEKDPLAIEVCRLVLTLSDYPNDNSWQLHHSDVFDWPDWNRTLGLDPVVMANPPYEAFSPDERRRINATKSHPPAELLHRLMRQPPRMLGLVLPQSFLSSPFYQEANRQLAHRYDQVSIVELPPVFRYADNETIALLASGRRDHGKTVTVHYSEVPITKADAFLSDFETSSARVAHVAIPQNGATFSLWIPQKESLFQRLAANNATISTIASVHQGIRWRGRHDGKPKTAPRTDVVSDKPKKGFVLGAEKMAGNLQQFRLNHRRYLSLLPDDVWPRDKAWKLPWARTKVVCNRSRFERQSPWRLAAWADHEGLAFTQQFIAIWPDAEFSEFALAAVLSSPVANAFCAERDLGRDNHVATIAQLPLPATELLKPSGELHRLGKALQQLLAAADFAVAAAHAKIAESLVRLDAAVLEAYALPARTQRQLLNQFQNWPRPVSASFSGYFPAHFKDTVSLKDLVAIQFDWDETNDRRCALIEKEISSRRLGPGEREELDHLQQLADLLVRLKAPYPLDELNGMIEKLKAKGKWKPSI
jgi:hypothetical protein